MSDHVKGWRSTSDEAWDRPGICLADGHAWPCDTAVAEETLRDLVTAIEVLPHQHSALIDTIVFKRAKEVLGE